MIRKHWEEVEDRARDHLNNLREIALPQRRRLTEREQLHRYLSYGPKEFEAMRNWTLKEKGDLGEFDRYITRMEKLRGKYA